MVSGTEGEGRGEEDSIDGWRKCRWIEHGNTIITVGLVSGVWSAGNC